MSSSTRFWGLSAMLAVVGASQGCLATESELADQAEGAASSGTGTVSVANAKVAICDDDEEGCARCDEKIGDYTLTPDERDACTLKSLRGGLRDRINLLISQAGRQGFFLRTAGDDSTLKLARIKVIPDVTGEKSAKSQYTKLSGSFTVGATPVASGGVSVYSVFLPIRVAFEFEDSTGAVKRKDAYAMKNTYNLTPFFYMNAVSAVNLSLGSILSKFGGGPLATTLLAALGGNSSLQVDAAYELKWTSPVCVDTSDDRSDKPKNTLSVFDNDFLTNILVPVCLQYKKDNHANVNCELDPRTAYPTETLLERQAALADRKILAVQGCSVLDKPLVGTNTYRLSFVAPTAWGFKASHQAFLYEANKNAGDIWKRETELSVIGVDGRAGDSCGVATLGEDETCVHTKLATKFFNGTCDEIAKPGARTFGVAQTTSEPQDETIQYRVR